MGEPAGVGPELCLHLLNAATKKPIVIIGDYQCLAARARLLKMPFDIARITSPKENHKGRAVLDCPLAQNANIGKPAPENAAAVLRQLQMAVDGCLDGSFLAMTTAPVQKSSIITAGFDFVGQTEYIAARAKVQKPVMMLAGKKMRVALATTHLPLAKVAAAISCELLFSVLQTLNAGLIKWCNIAKPRIAVSGLNPHCGEDGFLGDEEKRAIIPAVQLARQNGECYPLWIINIEGPIAADSVFMMDGFDCVLAMYHDQGLPVIKFAGADSTTNITLGLPFLRTSPAHGTALDIAGSGKVRAAGMLAAASSALAAL